MPMLPFLRWKKKPATRKPGAGPREPLHIEELERRELLTAQALSVQSASVLSLLQRPTDNLTLATLTVSGTPDQDPSALVTDWGDGTASTAQVVSGDGGLAVQALHDYASDGVFDLHLTVTADDQSQEVIITVFVQY